MVSRVSLEARGIAQQPKHLAGKGKDLSLILGTPFTLKSGTLGSPEK